MTRLRALIRSFFGFSRTESNAFLIMLPLMAALAFSAPTYRWWIINHTENPVRDNKILDSLVATWKWTKQEDSLNRKPTPLLTFNPNTATQNALISLGLSEKLSQRIIHYRAKGGKFKTKKDFSKIYGLDSLVFLKLYAFIDLPERINSPTRLATAHFPNKTHSEPFDLNSADTSRLIKINGIGPRLSIRITAYRNRLGGFVSMDQLQEVYGLDSAVISRIKKQAFIQNEFKPRQININTANEKQLRMLPYIRFTLAKSIAVYRFQHGPFDSADGLKNIALMDEPTFQKIKPYITVKD